ncbi:hypothetical protein, partial [Burkholderia ubonensis]|uniref:hypothetical protein n=1 Tax=Burkholderia ubonensis TaxID=101571 RepID=UPI001E4AC9C5
MLRNAANQQLSSSLHIFGKVHSDSSAGGLTKKLSGVPDLTRFNGDLTHVEWWQGGELPTMLGIEMGGVRPIV